jgi:hypothetical protein
MTKYIPGMKHCYLCRQYKVEDQFGWKTKEHQKRETVCISCKKELMKPYMAEYYRKHKEELLPKHRESARISNERRRHGKDGTSTGRQVG